MQRSCPIEIYGPAWIKTPETLVRETKEQLVVASWHGQHMWSEYITTPTGRIIKRGDVIIDGTRNDRYDTNRKSDLIFKR